MDFASLSHVHVRSTMLSCHAHGASSTQTQPDPVMHLSECCRSRRNAIDRQITGTIARALLSHGQMMIQFVLPARTSEHYLIVLDLIHWLVSQLGASKVECHYSVRCCKSFS